MNDSVLRRLTEPDHGLTRDRHDDLKEQLMATLLNEEPAIETRPAPVDLTKRRRSKIAVGAAIAVLAVGGAAAAGSLFPDDAAVLPIGDCRTESSIQEAVATIESGSGNTVQLFTTRASADAPINGHALLETTPDGQTLGGSSGCNPPGTPDGRGDIWAAAPSLSGPDLTFVWVNGKAPADATRVEIDLSDGDTAYIDVQTDGYFLKELIRPGVGEGADAPSPQVPLTINIRAFDAADNLIAEQAL